MAEATHQVTGRAIHVPSVPTYVGVAGVDKEEVRRLAMLSEPELHRILFEWNQTAAEFPRDKCVHEMFEEQVARTPDAVALVFEGASLTYAELNRRANQLAHYLGSVGVTPDSRIAICAERGFEMVVALLAVD